MAEEVILSYKDVVLRRSDLHFLDRRCYLNDSVIEFYFGYLSSLYQSNDILLVSPAISFWLANCQDPDGLKDFVEPLNLVKKQLIIFTVNNNDDTSANDGGTHWSLLVYHRNSNTFAHCDSMGGFNSEAARKLYEAVKGFVGTGASSSMLVSSLKDKKEEEKSRVAIGVPIKSNAAPDDDPSISESSADPSISESSADPSISESSADPSFSESSADSSISESFADPCISESSADPSFTECSTPRQTNCYDCGLYVMAFARVFCQRYMGGSNRNSGLWFSALEKHVDESVELKMRIEVVKIIVELKKRNSHSS